MARISRLYGADLERHGGPVQMARRPALTMLSVELPGWVKPVSGRRQRALIGRFFRAYVERQRRPDFVPPSKARSAACRPSLWAYPRLQAGRLPRPPDQPPGRRYRSRAGQDVGERKGLAGLPPTASIIGTIVDPRVYANARRDNFAHPPASTLLRLTALLEEGHFPIWDTASRARMETSLDEISNWQGGNGSLTLKQTSSKRGRTRGLKPWCKQREGATSTHAFADHPRKVCPVVRIGRFGGLFWKPKPRAKDGKRRTIQGTRRLKILPPGDARYRAPPS